MRPFHCPKCGYSNMLTRERMDEEAAKAKVAMARLADRMGRAPTEREWVWLGWLLPVAFVVLIAAVLMTA